MQAGKPCARGRHDVALRPRSPSDAGLASRLLVWRRQDHARIYRPIDGRGGRPHFGCSPRHRKAPSGGTDLLVQLRSGRVKPGLIVDIKKIPDISGIRERDGAFVIGAATPGAVIGECDALEQAWPGVVEAADSDRLDPSPGPGIACRQSLQCVAGGR